MLHKNEVHFLCNKFYVAIPKKKEFTFLFSFRFECWERYRFGALVIFANFDISSRRRVCTYKVNLFQVERVAVGDRVLVFTHLGIF